VSNVYKVKSKSGILILVVVIMVSGITAILGRVLSIAIPAIQKDFQADIMEIQWVFNLGLIVIAVFTMISGAVSDKYGIKKIFISGIIIFALGCICSGLSTRIEFLIYSQGLCGLGVVLMGPCSLAIINSCFEDDEKSRATGIWVGIGAFFGVAGLLFGGYMVEYWGWRIPFFCIAGLSAFTLILAMLQIPNIEANSSIRLVPFHALTLAIGLLGISYILIYFSDFDWQDLRFITASLIGFFGILAFIYFQSTLKSPLIPKAILQENELIWSNILTFLFYFTLNGLYIYAILNFQDQYHFSPSEAGLAMLPPSLMVALFASPLGKYSDRYGIKWFIVFGSFFAGIGFLGLAYLNTSIHYFPDLLLPLILIGLGMVLFVAPVTKGAMSKHKRNAGAASGLNNTIARISGLFAVAILGLIWSRGYEYQIELSENMIGIDSVKIFGNYEIPSNLNLIEQQNLEQVIISALNHGFKIIMLVSAGLAFLATVLSFFFLKSPTIKSLD